VADHRTRDTSFAAWLEWKKKLAVVPLSKIRGKASFEILGVNDRMAALLFQEYQQTEFFDFDQRRRAMTLRIPEDSLTMGDSAE
jgi:hypothetical protein